MLFLGNKIAYSTMILNVWEYMFLLYFYNESSSPLTLHRSFTKIFSFLTLSCKARWQKSEQARISQKKNISEMGNTWCATMWPKNMTISEIRCISAASYEFAKKLIRIMHSSTIVHKNKLLYIKPFKNHKCRNGSMYMGSVYWSIYHSISIDL